MLQLLALFFSLNLRADNTVFNLELGQDYLIPKITKRAWVENKSILNIIFEKNRYYIKSLKTGKSYVRLDDKLILFKISAAGYHSFLQQVQKINQVYPNTNTIECQNEICLSGTISNLDEYIKITSAIASFDFKLYFDFKINTELQKDIKNFVLKKLNAEAVPNLQIIFDSPWRIVTKKGFLTAEQELVINKLGLKIIYSASATELAQNIKVHVKIAEISKNFERKIGIKWPDSVDFQVLNNQTDFKLTLAAAEKSGEAKILAEPNLICRSGKEALFFVGGEFPIKIISARSKDVAWKKYGIELKLKPFADSAGQMSLQIETEVSTLDRSIVIDDIPAIYNNKVSTFFDLIEKRTIAISGLIRNEESLNHEGVPFLRSLPIIGSLFESKNFQNNKSELIIFVTPEVIN